MQLTLTMVRDLIQRRMLKHFAAAGGGDLREFSVEVYPDPTRVTLRFHEEWYGGKKRTEWAIDIRRTEHEGPDRGER